jgi:energy-coupling factor transporter ATP-binding protein EcfA2
MDVCESSHSTSLAYVEPVNVHEYSEALCLSLWTADSRSSFDHATPKTFANGKRTLRSFLSPTISVHSRYIDRFTPNRAFSSQRVLSHLNYGSCVTPLLYLPCRSPGSSSSIHQLFYKPRFLHTRSLGLRILLRNSDDTIFLKDTIVTMDIRDPPVPFVIYRARNPRRSNMFTKTGARSQRSASQPIYNPYKSTNGTAARHPYFSISIDSINATIKDMCDPIAKALESSQPKISPDPKLVEYLLKCQSGPLMKVTVVVFTGTQGIGKSTLINAVLGVEIADVSGGTHACTQYGSRYVCKHTQGDSPDLVDVVLEFLSVENLTDVIDEFARRYLDYHYPTKEEDESPGGDDQCKSETEKQNPAASAKLAFDIIFKTEKDEYAERRLQALLTPENIQSGLFLEQALEEAQDRIHELGCDHDGKLQIQNISIQVLKEVKELAKANFVLVDIMEIAITSPLLKNGLVLVDSPGKYHSRTFGALKC